jgi:hypothetical protein
VRGVGGRARVRRDDLVDERKAGVVAVDRLVNMGMHARRDRAVCGRSPNYLSADSRALAAAAGRADCGRLTASEGDPRAELPAARHGHRVVIAVHVRDEEPADPGETETEKFHHLLEQLSRLGQRPS